MCPRGSGLEVVIEPAGRPVAQWIALPSVRTPKTLIPIKGAAASVALTQFNDSMSQYARLRKWLVGQGARLGMGRFSGGRMVAIVGHPTDPGSDLLGGVLPEFFGEPIVTSVMLGERLRPNAKPVLQILRPDGVVLAYAKLGWNSLTNDLISNEARFLDAWAARPSRTLTVPRRLGLIDWNGVLVLLVEPVPQRVFRRGPRAQLPSPAVVREVASLGGERSGPLSGAPSVRRLIDAADATADDAIRTVALGAVGRILDEVGDLSIHWGTAHGDWGPWNMSRTSGGLHVWDWERAAHGVPVGTDVLHFCFQTRALGSRRTVSRTVAVTLAAADRHLADLGIERRLRNPLLELYLVEMLLRLEAGRGGGASVDERLLDGLTCYLARAEGVVR
jgi:hypothetical protein